MTSKERYDELRAAGLCTACKKPSRGAARCKRCSKEHSERESRCLRYRGRIRRERVEVVPLVERLMNAAALLPSQFRVEDEIQRRKTVMYG